MPQNQKQSPKPTSPTIVLTGGGSGGHITPLLSLAHALKAASPNCSVIYIGQAGEKVIGLQDRYSVFDEVFHVRAGKFRRYHNESALKALLDVKTVASNVKDLAKVVAGTNTAEKILKKVKPAVVFSKGGYVAVPVGLAAKWQRIPIITHDSDTVPGLANRIVGRWAKVHLSGMPVDGAAHPKDTSRYVGIPVDERIKPVSSKLHAQFKKKLSLPLDSLVLLAAGGGQGSQKLNNMMTSVAPALLDELPSLRIIHFTGVKLKGQQSKKEIEDIYKSRLSVENYQRLQLVDFTSNFYEYSGAADLIVTRAGATALAEFALQAKACAVIPNPYLANGHQVKNAEELRKIGAVVVLDESAPARQLQQDIIKLLSDKNKLQSLSTSLHQIAKPDAATDIAEIILSVAKH